MSVQKTTNSDKGVKPPIFGKLDLKLFPGATTEKPVDVPATVAAIEALAPITAQVTGNIPAPPATIPVDFSAAAYGQAIRACFYAATQAERLAAFAELTKIYGEALAHGERFGDRPKLDDFPKVAAAAEGTNAITFSHIKDILARKSRTEWLPGLKDILERKVLALLVAQRNTFKSFIALEWAMRGAVAGCGVVVLSGEGGGLDRRIDAWVRTHGEGVDVTILKFVALEKPVNLNDAQVLTFVTDRIRELGWPLDLFVVDTLSKFTPGLEENDNTENAKFLTALSDAIRYQFDATVLLVAHAGHSDPGRPRGASTLMANPDAEYVVERREMLVQVTRERLKDSPSLLPLAYQGKVVDLQRTDEALRPITSLAFSLSNAPLPPVREVLSTGNQKTAWDALKALLAANGRPKDAPGCVPPTVAAVPYVTAVESIKAKFEGKEKPRRIAERAIDAIVAKKFVAMDQGWLWAEGTKVEASPGHP